MGTYTYMSLRV